MEVIPAIDIRGGFCVRLLKGDFSAETIYSDDPIAVARAWQEAGAGRLHVVDLDGARVGRPINVDAIGRILEAVSVPVQIGGGLRDIASIRNYMEKGADRLILGTAAVANRPFIDAALQLDSRAIAVAVDAAASIVVTEGWTRTSNLRVIDYVRQLTALGVPRIIYTDVGRDGTLTAPNYTELAILLRQAGKLPVIYSGGIASVDHLHDLANTGAEGAIVGKALYTGDIDLAAALAQLS